uniref:Uncharacterized protein n=1 Tax=Panagrolaimus davidi TaxID=227884 RepID=A0A914PX12_9BILA
MFNSITNESEIWLDFCNLTDINPWDSTIMEFIKPEKDHMLNCIPKLFEHSKLINGQLFLYSNGTFKDDVEMGCEMRCLFPKSDWDLEYGNWIKVFNGTKPKCDVIEVQCKKNDGKVYYTFFHAQVYRKIPPPSIPLESSKKYDVHVIVLDAVSQTQFIRSMPKTFYFLREYYDAIPFKYFNKIGINSHPNGFAFLIGKMFEFIPKSPFSRGHIGQYPNRKRACRTPLDNEQFIGFRYKDDGYVTMMAEDWMGGALSYPYCEGFHKTPMDHYMK